MSVYTALAAHALFPLHERLKGHDSVRRRRALERSQWWAPEVLRAAQTRRLRDFLAQIQRTVPYYRALFAHLDFEPRAVTGAQDLAALPLLDKATVRAQFDALRALHARRLARYTTGGSSGEPLSFLLGQRVSHDVAAKWRATRWWGVDIGDPEIVLWGSPIERGAQDRVRALRDALLRSRFLPAFALDEARLAQHERELRRRRPRMLFGYPSALARLAAHVEARSTDLASVGLRVVFVTGERLYPEQRALMERVFGCPVANGYGARDAGFIAHECPAGRMHVSAEDIVLEAVDAAGRAVAPGTPGELVVTHLATPDFPFVRYRTGDVGVLDPAPCPCGRGLPVLREVEGRRTDFVVAADGTVMHGLALIYVLREQAGIRAFKITQHSRAHTRVQVVPDGALSPATAAAIRSGLQARLGAAVRIDLEPVPEIAPEASGKYRYVVSEVAP